MADFAKASQTKHKPVLLQEAIDGLELKPGETFVDATYGGGGHTNEVRSRFPRVKTVSIDQDPDARADITANFRELDKILGDIRPDAILFDLGFSSDQMDASGRGFSFLRDEPLDMRLSQKGPTAADILNSWDEHAIELVLRGFGEEKHSRRIAKKIVERRSSFAKASGGQGRKAFETTFDLVEVVGGKQGRIHPATRTFQALRIAVNDELSALEQGLEKAFDALRPGGRLAVISFHSLEDRIVKNFFRDKAKMGLAEIMGKKPIVPGSEELRENPRSRSAKLRIIKKS